MESPPTFPGPERIQSTMTKKGRCLGAQSAYALWPEGPPAEYAAMSEVVFTP